MGNKCIAVLSTDDFGGAGESAFRITHGLRKLGYKAVLIVKHKSKNDDFVIQVSGRPLQYRPLIIRVLNKIYNKFRRGIKRLATDKQASTFITDPNFYFFNVDESIGFNHIIDIVNALPFQPDLILAGWVSSFINTENMLALSQATRSPLYWLTTDMAPLTGGCHYSWDCLGYTVDCSNCPAILTEELKQSAKRNLTLKLNHVHGSNIRVLAGSEWCRRQAAKSTLFKDQESIPVLNGLIDQSIFNDRCRDIAKQVFGLSNTDKIIFTGATFTQEKRKGIKYLVKALQKLYDCMSSIERTSTKVLVAGKHVLDNELVQQIPFNIVPIDFIKDDRLLSLAYQAADVFVSSSIEDAGPMMVNEALACGTPVVGFDLGFVADIVEHGRNGFRVSLKNTDLMAECIHKVLALPLADKTEFSRCAIQAINDKVSLKSLGELIDKIAN